MLEGWPPPLTGFLLTGMYAWVLCTIMTSAVRRDANIPQREALQILSRLIGSRYLHKLFHFKDAKDILVFLIKMRIKRCQTPLGRTPWKYANAGCSRGTVTPGHHYQGCPSAYNLSNIVGRENPQGGWSADFFARLICNRKKINLILPLKKKGEGYQIATGCISDSGEDVAWVMARAWLAD